MKRVWIVLCVFLASGLTPILGGGKDPIIVFDSLTKDFGAVTEGETLKHVFKFTNKGEVPLEILKWEAS